MSSERGQAMAQQLYEEAYHRDISKSLYHRVVEELQTHIVDIMHKQCYGCIVDHPSQTQHPLCLFTTKDEWVDMFMYQALKKLNMYKVMDGWYDELKLMNLSTSEKAEAYQLWNSIKENVDSNNVIPQDALTSEWAERVNGAWSHGDN